MIARWSVLLLSLCVLDFVNALQVPAGVSISESESFSLSSSTSSTSSEPHPLAPAESPKSTTLFSTHPAIAYHPNTDCIHRILWLCTGRAYAWNSHDYAYNPETPTLDSADSNTLNRSFAVVTNEHNNDYGNGAREVVIRAPRAKEIKIYGVPPVRAHGHDMAAQELCIDSDYLPPHEDQQQMTSEARAARCISLDVQRAYREALNDWEPVSLWSGTLASSESIVDLERSGSRGGLSMARASGRDVVTIRLRMTERAHRKGEVTKWMTLDSVVCTGLVGVRDEGTRRTRTPPFGSILSKGTINARSWWRVGYTPQKRWSTSSRGNFMQASTVYDHFKNASIPRVAFSFKGADAKIWMAPRSQLELPPGGVELCFDSNCELIDVRQLYLNLPSTQIHSNTSSSSLNANSYTTALRAPPQLSAEDRPVLLWSAENLDYRRRHYVQISLIEPNPELYVDYERYLKGITFSHASYTRVFHKNSDRYWLALEDFIAEQLFISLILFAVLAYGLIIGASYILSALLILFSVCLAACVGCLLCMRRKSSRRDPHVFSPQSRARARRMHVPASSGYDDTRPHAAAPSEQTPLFGTPPSTYFDALPGGQDVPPPPAPSDTSSASGDWTSRFTSNPPPPYPHPPSYEAIAPSWSRVALGSAPRPTPSLGPPAGSASLRSSRPLLRVRTDTSLPSSAPANLGTGPSEPPVGLRRSLPPPYSLEDIMESEDYQ